MLGVSFVSLQLVKALAVCRTKTKMNPPVPVPQITKADT